MKRDLDSSLLRAFVTVAESGSFSAASTRLARTQAAVSMQLRRLEDELGHRLLERSSRGVRLTGSGEILLGFAQKALGAAEEARSALDGQAVAGTVRLGILEDVAITRLPRALAAFGRRYSSIAVEMHVACGEVLGERLRRGKLDVVVSDSESIQQRPARSWTQPLRWTAHETF
jgi:DNA-binding transcriptional LysR family regulator